MYRFNKILIIGAHYDDTELGVGGTAARLIHEGKEVYKITLTNNEVYSEDMKLNIKAARAKENSMESSKTLGIIEVDFPTQPFGKLEYDKGYMMELEHFIICNDIDTVFLHYLEDYQTDHLAAHKISKTAARHCRNILMYQSNPYLMQNNFLPNFFVDISEYIEIKKMALMCYDPEQDLQGRLFETTINRNSIWGYGNHVAYAEGFQSIKMCI